VGSGTRPVQTQLLLKKTLSDKENGGPQRSPQDNFLKQPQMSMCKLRKVLIVTEQLLPFRKAGRRNISSLQQNPHHKARTGYIICIAKTTFSLSLYKVDVFFYLDFRCDCSGNITDSMMATVSYA
jgi:hypothetical protein